MKRIIMAVLAIGAVGAAWPQTHTAEAAAQWWGSGWKNPSTLNNFSIDVLGGSGNPISAQYVVGPFQCDSHGQNCVTPPGVSRSANTTGTVAGYPTCDIATEECSDGSFINAPGLCEYSVCNDPSCVTVTSQLGPNSQGYYGYYSGGIDTGYCPSAFPYIKGGVWLYEWQ
jgi:hypothetical protein